jgi:hypothetical protein
MHEKNVLILHCYTPYCWPIQCQSNIARSLPLARDPNPTIFNHRSSILDLLCLIPCLHYIQTISDNANGELHSFLFKF